jgi:branched-subunit amino acid ABC-type transport system permease component
VVTLPTDELAREWLIRSKLCAKNYLLFIAVSLQYLNTPILASISALVFMIVVLLVKPTGLFGRE